MSGALAARAAWNVQIELALLVEREGLELYALRKQRPEPVFGIIKSVMGFRQFLLRGLANAKGEWNRVTMSWNIRRMFVLQPA